jgi:tRNA nucleotidyltransferase (CCA-adding enzyme)
MSAKTSGQKALKQLNEAGYEAYFVGGMVRDALLGRDVYDADITTNATPEEVKSVFKKTFDTGLQHGTVTVLVDDENVEVTTFRVDGDYSDNRRPDKVVFTPSLEEDLARRDFTINAMAQHLDGTIVDLFKGRLDLDEKLIRAVGNPKKRFEEDALRILRGVRFVAKLGFNVEEKTLEAMKDCHHLLATLSLERIRKEFEGMIEGEYRAKAFKLMLDYKLFDSIPYFSKFCNYELESLAKMDDFKLMILLAEAGCGDSEGFLTHFPLSRREKKLIKDTYKASCAFSNLERDRLVQYYFGLETAQIMKKYESLRKGDKDFTYIPCNLPIASRSDLIIQPEEVIKLSEHAPGPWIGKLFTEIEEAVLLGEIRNNREELIAFMTERGIFDEKEN